MKVICYLFLIALLGCRTSNQDTVGPERIENAFINDTSQFADGCDINIQLDAGSLPPTGIQYKPAPASLLIAQRAIAKLAPNPKDAVRIPIRIRFLETTNQVIIHCGWYSPTVTEIEILEIMSR